VTYHTIKEATRMLGVTRATVYHMKWRGEIDTIKAGKNRLVSDSSIRRVLAQQSV
jgi:excisionase family DNA binding protein